ncbi:hypothetical protein H072_4547 [Dactylellina haptotyla CBS 200.50]|uniref:BTB domain-containing protein n=1 Tax=Dactylellina haptotyla (strain CBS 200.50) TaxID=1284197 RepID=S8AK70_DACHA|nr:hypothetical protein H072_4547 [Dactylellina haptotyla CBS 200.50]
MSSRLWRAYFENDLEKFRNLLGLSEDRPRGTYAFNSGSLTNESHFDLPSPPSRQSAFVGGITAGGESKVVALNRFQINSRLPANILANPLAPVTGATLLHHAVTANKLQFVELLLKHPQTDLFLQDFESGWTALHRALYFGNISIAKRILSRDESSYGLVKIKDREGNSPFELFESTIKVESTKKIPKFDHDGDYEDDFEGETDVEQPDLEVGEFKGEYLGDEAYIWGSNKNLSLGFSDGDDRQFPERMPIPNPSATTEPKDALITLAPVYFKDIQMAKFHTAIITTAPSGNLFVCGHGPGGRLGLGHESTEFTFKQVNLPRRVRTVALGENHTVAVMENGDVFTWGSGRHGQLGYIANVDKNDKEEYQLIPRQVFTNLRREKIIGAAASRHHSIVHTTTSIFVFGKNEGQLGLVDADSRTLEFQTSPRKVASLSLSDQPIYMITATEKASAVLLENHEVWIMMNFGIMRVAFPFDRFMDSGLKPTRPSAKYHSKPNFITKLSCGGGTIAALSRIGDVFTINADRTTATTTRGLPVPQRIWSLRKRHMAVRDVDVGQDGAVVLCTESGSVWQRTRRSKVKETQGLGAAVGPSLASRQIDRAKDYKFARVPGLTHIVAVRSNPFGSFAAIRRDVEILKTQLEVRGATLWDEIGSLLSFYDEPIVIDLEAVESGRNATKSDIEISRDKAMDWFLQKDLVNVLKETIQEMDLTEYDTVIRSAELDEMGISIPAHSFVLTGRCPRLRALFAEAIKSQKAQLEALAELDHQPGGTFELKLKGINWFSTLIFIFYLYKDMVLSVWTRFTRNKEQTQLYQRVRTDLGLLAKSFGLNQLAAVASGLQTTKLTMDTDLEEALADPLFLETGDMLLELKDKTLKVHSSLLCARCSFFDALYHGGSGRWLASRMGEEQYAVDQLVRVDMKHVLLQTMEIVLKFLYSDKSIHLFDNVQIPKDGVDAFLDLVIDVLGVANELMLDRLVEISQKTIGRFVNTRNATSILAAISESSVSTFKDICFEYILTNLDTMMETRALDELDEDLIADLDLSVKERQLAYLPMVRSGRSEAELLERHPHLVEEAEKERQSVLQLFDSGQVSNVTTETDLASSPASYRQSSSFRAGSYEKQRRRRSSKSGQERPSPKSPHLIPAQNSDLMFDFDDEEASAKIPKTPISHSPGLNRNDSYGFGATTPKSEVWYNSKGKQIADGEKSTDVQQAGSTNQKTATAGNLSYPIESGSSQPWVLGSGIQSSKLDMREIMAQATKSRTSNLSLVLSSVPTEATGLENIPAPTFSTPITAKISQKERKRQQQQQQLQSQQVLPANTSIQSSTPDRPAVKASPWKSIRSPSNPLSFQNIPASPLTSPRRDGPTNKLLDVSNTPPSNQQPPSGLNTPPNQVTSPKQPPFTNPKQSLPTPPQVQSHRYNSSGHIVSPTVSASDTVLPRPDEFPAIGARLEQVHLPLAEIIQQEQIQQDIMRGKGPKQSIQDIQQEQEFMDWWEKESERYQQEELSRQLLEQSQKTGASRGRGRGGPRGGRGNFRGRSGKSEQSGGSHTTKKDAATSPTSTRGHSDSSNLRGRRKARGKGVQEGVRTGESSAKV